MSRPGGRATEILLVEDNPGDVRLTIEGLNEGKVRNNLHVARDGVEALAFLRREGEFTAAVRPDLILLDLNLPRKDGREQGRISVSVEDGPGEVCMSVSDDGPGIPAEHQQRIFERFYRVGGSTAMGTGVGLAIARGLVQLHGGKLWVESVPGAGSTFHITIPKIT